MNNNLAAVLIIFALVLGLLFVGGHKVKLIIIETLRREYTPGPYNPGFDPDRVDPNLFRRRDPVRPEEYQQQQQYQQQAPYRSSYEGLYEVPQKVPYLGEPEDWNKMWEEQRY